MKSKIIYMTLLFLFVVGSVDAQKHRSKEQRIKAVKIAFITEEIGLTVEQSQSFWPIYNELNTKIKALKKNGKAKPDIDNMSDAELETFLENHLKTEEEKIALHREYIKRYKTVISIRQIAQLSRAERRFKRELLRRAKERREGRGQ